jgi:hypothetical protein
MGFTERTPPVRSGKARRFLLRFSRHAPFASRELSPGYDLQGLDQAGHRALALDPTELALGARQARHAPSLYLE